MANTTEKKKAGRPKKTETATVTSTEDVKTSDVNTDALKEALAMIAELKGELNELKAQKTTPATIVESKGKAKKIKCISLCHHPVNVYTQADCMGKAFLFNKYGQIIQMTEDELLDVLAYYPNTMASGVIYICDNDIIADNGLEEAYEHIYDKDEMDMICLLRRECDAEFILNMSEALRDSTIIAVVENYKNGEKMDATALAILRDAGFDIVKIAGESKI